MKQDIRYSVFPSFEKNDQVKAFYDIYLYLASQSLDLNEIQFAQISVSSFFLVFIVN